MSREELQKGVFKIIADTFKMDEGELKPETNWIEDLNVKSVQGMKICALINYEYNIKFPLNELIECATLEDTINALTKYIDVNE